MSGPDEVYREAQKHFCGKDLVDLALAINAGNRFAIPFRLPPGGTAFRGA